MFGNNYNPQMDYRQRLMQMEQMYGQPQPPMQFQQIQTIQPVQPQVQTLFVNDAKDLEKIQVMPNVYNIGINKQAKEIYVRVMNNDGLTELNTYTLASEKQEKSDIEKIYEKLDSIETRLKGQENGRSNKQNNVNDYARGNAKQPHNGNVSTNDVE